MKTDLHCFGSEFSKFISTEFTVQSVRYENEQIGTCNIRIEHDKTHTNKALQGIIAHILAYNSSRRLASYFTQVQEGI